MPTVEFERTFQAAHRLSGHAGKCSRIHGHNFKLKVVISTDALGADGFVIEFEEVKQLIDRFDHRLILSEADPLKLGTPADWTILMPADPTTEYMAQWFADAIADLVAQKFPTAVPGVLHVKTKLRETDSILAYGHAQRHG